MNLNAPIEAFITAVKDNAAADLENSLRAAWSLMTVQQKRTFLASSAVDDALKNGVGTDVNIDGEVLTAHMDKTLGRMEAEILNANYGIHRGAAHGLVYWEYEGHASEDGKRPDIVVAAYEHLRGKIG